MEVRRAVSFPLTARAICRTSFPPCRTLPVHMTTGMTTTVAVGPRLLVRNDSIRRVNCERTQAAYAPVSTRSPSRHVRHRQDSGEAQRASQGRIGESQTVIPPGGGGGNPSRLGSSRDLPVLSYPYVALAGASGQRLWEPLANTHSASARAHFRRQPREVRRQGVA
jgi:hypothetical protein